MVTYRVKLGLSLNGFQLSTSALVDCKNRALATQKVEDCVEQLRCSKQKQAQNSSGEAWFASGEARRPQARQEGPRQGLMGQLTVPVYENIVVLVAFRFEIVADETCEKGVASRC